MGCQRFSSKDGPWWLRNIKFMTEADNFFDSWTKHDQALPAIPSYSNLEKNTCSNKMWGKHIQIYELRSGRTDVDAVMIFLPY